MPILELPHLFVLSGLHLAATLPPMPTPLLADLSHIPWVALLAIGLSIPIGPIVIYIVFRAAQRRQELWHETARVALEKGQPLPPMPPDMLQQPVKEKPSNDIRSGLILIAVGAGLYLFLGTLVSPGLGYVGAIPGFIGIALLGFGIVHALVKRDGPPADRS